MSASLRSYLSTLIGRAFRSFDLARDMFYGTLIAVATLALQVIFRLITKEDWREHKWLWIISIVAPYVAILAVHSLYRLVKAPLLVYRDQEDQIQKTRAEIDAWDENPILDVDIRALYIQPIRGTAHCNVFLQVCLTLYSPRFFDVENYKLTPMLHGNEGDAARFAHSLKDWVLVKDVDEKKGLKGYVVTELIERVDRNRGPLEGWLHFVAYRIGHDREDLRETVFRLHVQGRKWNGWAEIRGSKDLFSFGASRFGKLANP